MAASSCTPQMILPDSNVESDEEDSDEELPTTWSGLPQPIYFPVIKDETKNDGGVKLSLDSEEEVNDLCSPSSVIDLVDSDDEDVVEHHKESKEARENDDSTLVNNILQQQYIIDLTTDEEDNISGVKNDDDGYDDDRVDNSVDKGSGGELSVGYTNSQSCMDSMDSKEVEVCDSSCVITPSFICKACNKCYISLCSLYLPGLVKEANYLCTICMTMHNSGNVFYEHLKSHKNRYVTCKLCKDKIKSLVCCVCSCKFDSEKLYKQHQEMHAGQQEKVNVKLSCSVCKRNFVSKTLLEIHERLHTEELFKCDLCGGQFWTQQILVEHQEFCGTSKPTSWIKCTLCQEGFRTESAMTEHLKLCMQAQPRFYYCEICPQLFSCADDLVVHRLEHVSSKGINVLDCDCCDMKFFSASGLAAHKYFTTGKVTYSCSPCNIQFLLESSFVSHLRLLHSAEAEPSKSSNTKPKNIILEEVGLNAGKTSDGNNISQHTIIFQIVPHDDGAETCLFSHKPVEKSMRGNNLPSYVVGNSVYNMCSVQNNSPPYVESHLSPKRSTDKVNCSDEQGPSKKHCNTTTQNTIIEQTDMSNNSFKSALDVTRKNMPQSCSQPSELQLSNAGSSPEDNAKQSENVAVEKNTCNGKVSNEDISKDGIQVVYQLLNHKANQKFFLPEEKVEKLVKNQGSLPCPLKNPVPVPAQHDSLSTNQRLSFISKRFFDNINGPDDTPVKKLCKYSERNYADNFAAVVLPNHCCQKQPGTQKAQVIPVKKAQVIPVTSASKCSSRITYPTSPKSKPPQLLQVYSTASSPLKQTNNCSKVELPLHIVTYANSNKAQNIGPTIILAPAIGTANFGCPSQIMSLSVGSPQSVQKHSSPEVLANSNIQPGSRVLRQNSVSNNQIRQSKSTVYPGTLHNDSSNIRVNSFILQTVNVTLPQVNQNAGYISSMLPVNITTQTSPVGKSKNVLSTPKMISENTFKFKVNRQQPEVGVGKNHILVYSQTASKNKLTSKINSNTFQTLPVDHVKNFPSNKVAKVLPGKTNPPQTGKAPCKSSALQQQPVFIEIFNKPGNSRLQRSSDEMLIDVKELPLVE